MTALAQSAKGDALVNEQAQLVLLAQGHQFWERTNLAGVHVDALGDQEAARLQCLFGILLVPLVLLNQQAFQILDIVVLEERDRAARGIQAFLNGKVNCLIPGEIKGGFRCHFSRYV